MKQLLPITLILAMAVITRAEEKSAPAAAPVSDEAALRTIYHDWYGAFAKGDVAALEKLVPNDDCLWIDSEGNVSNIRQVIADVKSGAYKCESAHIDKLNIRVFGDAAVVMGLETEKSTYKGKDASGQYRFTDTFVKRNGTWVCVATVNQLITPPKP